MAAEAYMKSDTARSNQKVEQVLPVRVTLPCKECNEGEMLFTGTILPCCPPYYIHKCNNCGFEVNIQDNKYPRQDYMTKEEIEKYESSQ